MTHSPIAVTKTRVTMDFSTAIKALAGGAKITKLEWCDSSYYGILRDGKVQLHKPAGTFHDWIISDGDLQGTDWVILND